jgi:hypothetical protein
MVKKPKLYNMSMFLTSIIFGVLIFSGEAVSQSMGIGKSFDEVEKLAVKEGKSTGW